MQKFVYNCFHELLAACWTQTTIPVGSSLLLCLLIFQPRPSVSSAWLCPWLPHLLIFAARQRTAFSCMFCAARCASHRFPIVTKAFHNVFESFILLSCRAICSLARLQLHRPALLKAAADRSSSGQLSAATPHALACLAAGLAHWGYAPHEAWQQQLCDEAAAQMSGFTAQVGL